jgi:hypothetical protein
MFTSLRIQNFKCWKDTGEFRLAPLSGFFGANSSGKTSLLQFLLMLKQTVDVNDPSIVLNLGRGESLVDLGSFSDILYKNSTDTATDCLVFEFAWKMAFAIIYFEEEDGTQFQIEEQEEDHYRFECRIDQSTVQELKRISVTNFHYIQRPERSTGIEKIGMSNDYKFTDQRKTDGREINDIIPLPTPRKFYLFPSGFYYEEVLSQEIDSLEFVFEHQFDQMFYLGPLRSYPERRYIWQGSRPYGVGKSGENTIGALLGSRIASLTVGGQRLEEYIAEWLIKLGLVVRQKSYRG